MRPPTHPPRTAVRLRTSDNCPLASYSRSMATIMPGRTCNHALPVEAHKKHLYKHQLASSTMTFLAWLITCCPNSKCARMQNSSSHTSVSDPRHAPHLPASGERETLLLSPATGMPSDSSPTRPRLTCAHTPFLVGPAKPCLQTACCPCRPRQPRYVRPCLTTHGRRAVHWRHSSQRQLSCHVP